MRKTLAVAGVLVVAAISLARQPGALQRVYAEDGTIFLADALNMSTMDAIARPYAGYLHTVPRVLAELMTLAPLEYAAIGFAVVAALVTGLMALLVYVASGSHLTEPLQRVLAAAVVVLVPVAQDELPNSVANLHWPALYLLFWVLIWDRPNRTVAVLAILLTTLSDILAVVFLPLAVWRWYKSDRQMVPGRQAPFAGGSTTRDHVLVLAYGLGLAGQAAAMLFGPAGRELHPDLVRWLPWYAIRAVPTGLFGERFFRSDVDTRWLLLAGLAWLLLAAVVSWTWRIGDRSLAALAGAHSVALYALPVMLSGTATPRYVAAPAMLLTAALVALCRQKTWMLAVYLTIVWAVSFHLPSQRDEGPIWTVPPSHCGDVPISPVGWTVSIKCPG